jgi:uncharacterized Zn ribbon protein
MRCENPSSGATRHLLPQGEKEEASASRSFQRKHHMDIKVGDSNGAKLADGDTVTLIKI